jgi:transglutaminase-like putative cysteine protease
MSNLQRLLNWLLYGAALLAILPVLPFVALWVQIFLGAGLIAGLLRSRMTWTRAASRLAALVTIVATVVSGLQLSMTEVALPLIQVLCILLAARLASEKTSRNMLQSFVLALTLLAASSLLTLDMTYLIYLGLMVLLLSAGLVLLSFVYVDPAIQLSVKALKGLLFFLLVIPVATLVLMTAFFFVLPRTPTPLWNIVGQERIAAAGMSDQVRPGSFSDLASSGDIAFRAETTELGAQLLYWRGIVLDQVDGPVWRRSNRQPEEQFRPGTSSRHDVVIYAEPKADTYLVSLDRSDRLQGVPHRLHDDGGFVRQRHDYKRTAYRAVGWPQGIASLSGPADFYLRVPETLSPQVRQAAAAINIETLGFAERVAGLEAFFLRQQLSYAANNLPETETPVATFLFDSRRGYCEHFASAFAVMLRLMDVPARLVGGYLGGTYNRFGEFYLVTEDRAHVWVEALNDQGEWVRIDPSRLAANADQAFSAAVAEHGTLQSLTDALFHMWTRRILNYDVQQQFQLLREVSTRLALLRQINFFRLAGVLLLISLGCVIAIVWKRRWGIKNKGLLHSYLRQVARCAGLRYLPPELGLYQLASLSGHPLCREFAESYGAALYGGKKLDPAQCQRLRDVVRQLKKERFVIEVALPQCLGDNGRSE